jgi:hypothetical protein
VLVCAPRFNRQESGLLAFFTSKGQPSEERLGDALAYVQYVKWFRGEDVSRYLHPKQSWPFRPFAPAVASLLPFDPMTSLNILNLVAHLIALCFIYLIILRLGFKYRWRIVGCLIYIFSFPTFYYGAIGYVDPVLLCFLSIGTYLIINEQWIQLAFVIILGTLVKETIIILIPVSISYFILHGISRKKQAVFIMLYCLSFIAVYYVAERYNPTAKAYIWQPSLEKLLDNLARPRSYLSFLLSFGFPGVLSLFAIRQLTKSPAQEVFVNLRPFVAGLITTFVLSMYAMLTAFADGRTIWTSYPFTIPLAIFALCKFVERRKIWGTEHSEARPTE